jgi:hypothetical protein
MSIDFAESNITDDAELAWLFNGFDEVAARRIDAAHLKDALVATPTPRHWVAVDADDDPGV